MHEITGFSAGSRPLVAAPAPRGLGPSLTRCQCSGDGDTGDTQSPVISAQTGERTFHRTNPLPSPFKGCSPRTACSDLCSGALAAALCSRASAGRLVEGAGGVVELPRDPAPGGTWQRGRGQLCQLDADGDSEVSTCTCGEAAWKTVAVTVLRAVTANQFHRGSSWERERRPERQNPQTSSLLCGSG